VCLDCCFVVHDTGSDFCVLHLVRGFKKVWSYLSTFHRFAILIYHRTEVAFSCVYWNVMWELGLPNCNCLVRIIVGSLCDSPSPLLLMLFFSVLSQL